MKGKFKKYSRFDRFNEDEYNKAKINQKEDLAREDKEILNAYSWLGHHCDYSPQI